MQKVRYKVTTLSPILISKLSGDRNMTETFDYIPGRVMLGIFASNFIREKKLKDAHQNADFAKYFLSDDVIFTNAFLTKNKIDLLPTPFSIQKNKDDDTIFSDLLFINFDDEYEQTKYIGGYCLKEDSIVKHTAVDKSLNFHHARDEGTNTSKEGMIFNYESIDKGQEFTGHIIGNKIESFISSLEKKEFEAFTGRSKTAQYGKIKVELEGVGEYNPEVTSHNTLTFLSDVILYNKNGQSTTDVSVFRNYLSEKLSREVEIEIAFIKTSRIDNYVSVWKLKKPSETAFAAGSCFLIKGLKDDDKENLKKLEQQGIGERRNEGLGRIKFGLQGEVCSGKELKVEKSYNDKPKDAPAIAKNIIIHSIQETIKRQIKSIAINDSTEFYLNNKRSSLTNSLIGRLESFVKGAGSIQDFKTNLMNLRKIASDNIKKSSLQGKDFMEFLQEKEISHDIVTEKPEFFNIVSEDIFKLYNVKSDENFNNNLFKDYYLTFFSYLRKQMKGGKKK